MVKILILDDEIDRVMTLKKNVGDKAEITHITDAYNISYMISTYKYDVIMLDHDLGYDGDHEMPNGNVAAKILAENRSHLGDQQIIVVHSLNPIGVANMLSTMKHCDHLNVYKIPFAWAKIKIDEETISFKL